MSIRYLSGINVDANTLFVDSANDRVGIGTTSPESKLHVAGGQLTLKGGTATDQQILFNFAREYVNGIYNSSGHFRLQDNSLGGTVYQWDGSSFCFPNGNVGIGTTSPDVKLSVAPSTDVSAKIGYAFIGKGTDAGLSGWAAFGNINMQAANQIALTQDGNGLTVLNAASGQNIKFRIANADKAIIDSSGNVGIGTTAPTEILNISRIATDNYIKVEAGGQAGNYSGLMLTEYGINWGWALRHNAATDLLHISYQDNTPTFSDTVTFNRNGNVGIGTTSPNVKLHVGGAARVTDGLTVDSGSQINLDHNYSVHGYLRFNQATFGSESAFGIYGYYGISLNTRSGSGVTILGNNGNVGIGTTSPSYKLTLAAASATDADIFLAGMTGVSNGFTVKRVSSSFVYSMIDGNLGVGTSTPGSRIEIAGTTGSYNSGIGFVPSGTGARNYRTYIATDSSFRFDDATAGATRLMLTSGGNFLIGTTTDAGYRLSVAGDILASAASGNRSVVLTTNNANAALNVIAGSGLELASDGTNKQLAFRTGVTTAMAILSTAAIRFNQYGSGTFTGTPTYNLGVDASGNVIELPGGVVDGSGTANYVTKWQDANTVTNSQIVDNGTNVGVNNTSPKTKLDINGAIGFGSKTMSMTDTFAAALTLNMNDHNGCYVKLTAFGDWGNHSTIAYLGEFFIQASAGSYNEPGIIIRQVDNTGGGDDIQAQILDPAGAGTRDFIIELKATSASSTPFTAYIQYEVRGQYNSVS